MQQTALNLQQLVGAPTEAVAWFSRHTFAETFYRNGLQIELARWSGCSQYKGALLVEMRQPPVTQQDGTALFIATTTDQMAFPVIMQVLPRLLLSHWCGDAFRYAT